MSNFYSEVEDKKVIRGDTLNLAFELIAKNGSLINDLALQSWQSVFTLRDPYTDLAIVWRLHDEKLFTADNVTDYLTSAAHGFENGDIVQLRAVDTLPAGLSALTNYYVINSNVNSFQISLTLGGAAIDFTDDGAGAMYAAMNSKLQKSHNDVTPSGNGIYYNNDVFTIPGLNITQDNQLVIVLTYKETESLQPDIYPFDIEFTINQMYKAKWTIKGNLIVDEEHTKSV